MNALFSHYRPARHDPAATRALVVVAVAVAVASLLLPTRVVLALTLLWLTTPRGVG
jgi:hypothetical protein